MGIDNEPSGGRPGEGQRCAFRHTRTADGSLQIMDAAVYGVSYVEGTVAVIYTGLPVSTAVNLGAGFIRRIKAHKSYRTTIRSCLLLCAKVACSCT